MKPSVPVAAVKDQILPAIGLMCLYVALIVCVNATGKVLTADYHPQQVVFFRHGVAFLLMLLLFAPRHGMRIVVPRRPGLQRYLFPETYSFPRGTSEAEIVAAMVDGFRTTFEEDVRPLLEGRLDVPAAVGAESRAADRATGAEARALEGAAGRRAGSEGEERTGTVGEKAAADDVSTPATPPDEPKRPVDEGSADEQRWTVRELVTLASIVEKEARVEEERGRIAAVYANRLSAGMGLYADPTVIYALRLRGEYDGNLTRENLRVDSPYNTYRYAGLPPGPIASPGRGSLRAAADPADVPYLYFVSRNDGTHVFSRTLSEHNRNVQRWQKQYWRDRWAEERRAREEGSPSPPTD